MAVADKPACGLCRTSLTEPFVQAHGRRYFQCDECSLIQLDPEQRLTPAAERAHYLTHENDPADTRYRAFLSRLADPLVHRLKDGSEGLDYGSGPGPTLSIMLREQGFPTAIYDPFFAADSEVLKRRYDFITCSETVEHFFAPGEEFQLFARLLKPGGWLAIMTQVVPATPAFEDWYYCRDPTHVCFFRPETMEWIARSFHWRLETPHPHVALFHRPPD